jgi:FkbM family methyltransferase
MTAVHPQSSEERASVTIGDITLTFKKADAGGTHYYGRGHFEEYRSSFYPVLKGALDPAFCIDVGANYGYTGMLMRRAFPSCNLQLIEPIPWLSDFVSENFKANGLTFDSFHSAIVSDGAEQNKATFGLNEKVSQDSRVIPQPGWKTVETDVVTLNRLTREVTEDQGVYIKIDTQGWEERVFAGGRDFLGRHSKWFIKTEFAPQWMDSQSSDPVSLLRDLIDRYDVFESPGRQRWNCKTVEDLVGTPLLPGCEQEFVSYVRTLVMGGKGWVDLYVLPPASRRAFNTGRSGEIDASWARRIGRKLGLIK